MNTTPPVTQQKFLKLWQQLDSHHKDTAFNMLKALSKPVKVKPVLAAQTKREAEIARELEVAHELDDKLWKWLISVSPDVSAVAYEHDSFTLATLFLRGSLSMTLSRQQGLTWLRRTNKSAAALVKRLEAKAS